MARLLDQQQVDTAGRWLVVDPVFMEILRDEDSRFMNADFGESGGLRNGLTVKNFHGFRLYSSSNLPKVGTGPGTSGTANQNANYGILVAGHDSAVATAEQINKTETYRDTDSFADMVVRFFALKQSLLPNITQHRGELTYGYYNKSTSTSTGGR